MTPRPTIFISAVSKELKTSRQLVANTLQFLGYEPVWQDIFGTEQGDLREMLRRQIDECQGVVQLVGRRYGAEPPKPDEQFGRVSYTQYEALYAKQRGKKVWYLFLDDDFPIDTQEPEPDELRELQATYRRRLKSESQLYHPLNSREGLETSVLKLRDDLNRLRRGAKLWATAVITLLAIIVGVVVWLEHGQRRENQQIAAMKEEMVKLREGVMDYANVQAQVRQEQVDTKNETLVEDRTYAELAKKLGVNEKMLREKLPQFAEKLQKSSASTAYERMEAAFVIKDYAEAKQLALQAADEALKTSPSRPDLAIMFFERAAMAARARHEYADALSYLREAEKSTDRKRGPVQWGGVQKEIAFALIDVGYVNEANGLLTHGQLAIEEGFRGLEDPITLAARLTTAKRSDYDGLEKEVRTVLAKREKADGAEGSETLRTRKVLADLFGLQGKYVEAEKELREILAIQKRVLGAGDPYTIETWEDLTDNLDFQSIVNQDQQKRVEAEKEYRAILAAEENQMSGDLQVAFICSTRGKLAYLLEKEGKYADAEIEYRQIIKLENNTRGSERSDHGGLAKILVLQGKYAEAETEYRAKLSSTEKIFDLEHPLTLSDCYNLALCLKAENKTDEAKTFARRAEVGATKVLGANHPDTLKYEKLWQELQITNSPPQP